MGLAVDPNNDGSHDNIINNNNDETITTQENSLLDYLIVKYNFNKGKISSIEDAKSQLSQKRDDVEKLLLEDCKQAKPKRDGSLSDSSVKLLENMEELEYDILLTQSRNHPLTNQQLSIIASRISELKYSISQENKVLDHLAEIIKNNKSKNNLDKAFLENVLETKQQVLSRINFLTFQLTKFRRLFSSFSGYAEVVSEYARSSAQDCRVLVYFSEVNCQIILGLKKLINSTNVTNKISKLKEELKIFEMKGAVIQKSIDKYPTKDASKSKLNINDMNEQIKFSGSVKIEMKNLKELPQFNNALLKKKRLKLSIFNSSKKGYYFVNFCVHGINNSTIAIKSVKKNDSKVYSTEFNFSNTRFLEMNVVKNDQILAISFLSLEDAVIFNKYTLTVHLHPKGQFEATFTFDNIKMFKPQISNQKSTIKTRSRVFNRVDRKTFNDISHASNKINISALSKLFPPKSANTESRVFDINSEESGSYISLAESEDYIEKMCGSLKGLTTKGDMSLGFKFLNIIGHGFFGEIILVENVEHIEKGEYAQIKYMAVKVLNKDSINTEDEIKAVFNERDIMFLAQQCPFTTRFYESFESFGRLLFLLEYCPNKDLLDHLQHSEFSQQQILYYSAVCVNFLEFLHKNDIIYRDLKLENICVDQSFKPKFIDFGISKAKMPIGSETNTFCGTYPYLPPEMIIGPSYDNSLDFWQLGVVMFLMTYRHLPFFSEDDDTLCTHICFKEVLLQEDLEIDALLKKLLEKNPMKRLGCHKFGGINAIKSFPYFSSVNWDDINNDAIKPPILKTLNNKTNSTLYSLNRKRMVLSRSILMQPTGEDNRFKGFSMTYKKYLQQYT